MDKIESKLSFSTLKLLIKDLKSEGKTIGLTHGAFDLFHSGHLYLLKEAAKKCDFLIVGIETDSNLKTYKSVKRPVIEQDDRHEIVNNISCVGNTFLIDFEPIDKEYDNLYRELQIDVLNIGSNFLAMQNIQNSSKKYGFSLNIVNIVKPVNSTFIIEKIQKSHLQSE
jgi:glycerol-3-phosphate cytidylyltransferase